MNDTIYPIMLGIVSSLIATFLFLFLNWLLHAHFLPWYSDKIYRGVRLDGRWIVVEVNGQKADPLNMIMQINQKGDRLFGLYSHGPKSKIEFYNLEGSIRDGVVILTYHPKSNTIIDAGAAILRAYIDNSKLRMKGILVYYASASATVKSTSSIEFEIQTA